MINGMAPVPLLTTAQLGRIREEYRRLGIGDSDREQRLAITAALLGLSAVATTKDLDSNEAGQLIGFLSGFDDQRGLQDAVAAVAAARRAKMRAKFFVQLAGVLARDVPCPAGGVIAVAVPLDAAGRACTACGVRHGPGWPGVRQGRSC